MTIPQEVRLLLGIGAGSEVDVEVGDDAVRLVRRNPGTGAALVATMRGRARRSPAHAPMTTDESMARCGRTGRPRTRRPLVRRC